MDGLMIGADIRIPSNDPTFEAAAAVVRRHLANQWAKLGLGEHVETVTESTRRMHGSDRDEQVVTIDWKPVDG
jgi:hypothetical protein